MANTKHSEHESPGTLQNLATKVINITKTKLNDNDIIILIKGLKLNSFTNIKNKDSAIPTKP